MSPLYDVPVALVAAAVVVVLVSTTGEVVSVGGGVDVVKATALVTIEAVLSTTGVVVNAAGAMLVVYEVEREVSVGNGEVEAASEDVGSDKVVVKGRVGDRTVLELHEVDVASGASVASTQTVCMTATVSVTCT